MKTLPALFTVACLGILSTKAGSQPDIYSTDYWEIPGPSGKITWIEIHNRKEAAASGIAHISVMARKKSSPVWELEWVCDHLAITTDALQRSVVRPLKTRGAYPERFLAGYDRWKEDEKKGSAVVCATSIEDFLKHH
jgi:hypothetical protein